jgi:hypothetical protein
MKEDLLQRGNSPPTTESSRGANWLKISCLRLEQPTTMPNTIAQLEAALGHQP